MSTATSLVLLMTLRFLQQLTTLLTVMTSNLMLITFIRGHLSPDNNMMFNEEKFHYISYHMGDSSKINNIYLSPEHNILPKSGEVKDLGILMSENCDFDSHIASVAKKCSRLCGWILRTFSTRSKSILLTLFKSIVLPHLHYGSQLWSPFKVKNINALEKVQRVFTI